MTVGDATDRGLAEGGGQRGQRDQQTIKKRRWIQRLPPAETEKKGVNGFLIRLFPRSDEAGR